MTAQTTGRQGDQVFLGLDLTTGCQEAILIRAVKSAVRKADERDRSIIQPLVQGLHDAHFVLRQPSLIEAQQKVNVGGIIFQSTCVFERVVDLRGRRRNRSLQGDDAELFAAPKERARGSCSLGVVFHNAYA